MNTFKVFSNPYGVLFLKLFVLSCAFYTIFLKIEDFQSPIPSLSFSPIIILVGFTSMNWFLEILKWKFLTSTITKITFKTALSQSLAAHTLAIITPNKIGEYGAKAAFYKQALRKNIVGLTFLGNTHQMLITSLFGVIGVLLYKHELFDQNALIGLMFLIILSTGAIYYLHKTKNIFSSFQKITIQTHLTIIVLSLLRYLFFSFQYLFLLNILGVQNSYLELLPIIWLTYFISSCIPSFALLDFTIKGSIALFLFSHLQIPNSIILTTAFLMWVFNFAMPAVIGGFYISIFNPTKLVDYDTAD